VAKQPYPASVPFPPKAKGSKTIRAKDPQTKVTGVAQQSAASKKMRSVPEVSSVQLGRNKAKNNMQASGGWNG